MAIKLFVFECSTNTYLECIEKGLFGSNMPWPLQVARGDFCILRHYKVGKSLALWKAETDGRPKIVPRAWGGRFPFQVRVSLASPEIIEVPPTAMEECMVSSATGGLDHGLEGDRAEALIALLQGLMQNPRD